MRDGHTGSRAHRGEQQTFDQELARQPAARRAEREPHAPFVAARGRASEQQIRDVGARDQQHQSDDDQHHEQRTPVVFAEAGRPPRAHPRT